MFLHGLVILALVSPMMASAKRVAAPAIGHDATDDKAFIETAQTIVNIINQRDVNAFIGLMDFSEFSSRVASKMSDSENWRKDFVKSFSQRKPEIIGSILQILDKTQTQAKYIKTIPGGDGMHALVRLNMGDEGYDYWELEMRRNHANSVVLVDWYQLSTGQMISTSVGAITNLMSEPSSGLFEKLFGKKKFDPKLLTLLKNMNAAVKSGEYKKAMVEFEKLPDEIKLNRVMCSIAINIASLSNDDELYKLMLSRLQANHATDPSAAFALLDYYYYQKDYDAALNNVSIIEKRIGIDGLTYLLRANIYLIKKDYTKSMEMANQAIALEPDFEDAYHTLSMLYIKLGRFKDAIEIFNILGDQFGYEFTRSTFEDNPELTQFVNSKEFNNWLKH